MSVLWKKKPKRLKKSLQASTAFAQSRSHSLAGSSPWRALVSNLAAAFSQSPGAARSSPQTQPPGIMSHRRRGGHSSSSPSSSSQRGRAVGDGSGPSEEAPRIRVYMQPKADGTGFELQPSGIVLNISREAYMSRMTACWPKWKQIPIPVKEAIWQDFLRAVEIDPADMPIVMRHWNTKIAKNYRDTMSGYNKAGKKPNWMSASVWDAWVVWWNSDEFKEESERNSANRNKNPVTHRGGAKSFQHHREDLERRYNREVSLMEVFTHTHAMKSGDEGGSTTYSWSDEDKATASYQKFQEARTHMLEGLGREELTRDEEDAIFDSIMDQTQHGRRFGYGNQAARGSRNPYSQSQDPEGVLARIDELEERDHRRAAEMAQMRILIAQMQQQGQFNSSGASGADDEDEA